MNKHLDEQLRQALTPTDEPDFWLNQRILNQAKEREHMSSKKIKRIPAAALAAVIVLGAGSVSAYAAWKYMTPAEMTENLYDQKLTQAFQGADAVAVNERQSYGGYDITFLGLVSGEDLSEFAMECNGILIKDRTYTAVAIEYSDGTPMPDSSDEKYGELSFFVSPFIKGYDPNRYNIVTMRGGYSEFVKNGVLYRLTECDNVEIFADHGLYLGVCDGTFYNQEAYQYEEGSGDISRNENYEGLNALFELPIDAVKADPQAAAAYQTSMEDDEEDTQDETELSAEEAKADAWFSQLTPENIEQYAKRVESTVQVLTPDEDGNVQFSYELDGCSGSGEEPVAMLFPDDKPGMSEMMDSSSSEDGLDGMMVNTYTLNEDGTVTFAIYIPKEAAANE